MERKFYRISDIQDMMGCSYTKAQDNAHMFLMQDKAVRHGHVIFVSVPAFNEWAKIKEGE